jgi:head-to-tail connecting protein
MLLTRLPDGLENGEALLLRRAKAVERKNKWRSIYQDAQRYAMPARETFNWVDEGSYKNTELYDTTLQDLTYTAANTMLAILFPPWARWAEFSPGGAIPKKDISPEIVDGLQEATEMFFGFLHSSNFSTVISEVALDLLIGTAALKMDEGDDEKPFVFTAIPLPAIELEEGPNGTVETKFMCRKPQGQHVERMYPGINIWDLPADLHAQILTDPTKPVSFIECEVYNPSDKKYYGVAVDETSKQVVWRYSYGESCPMIVGRATKVAGEVYGRGRVLLALSDAKTLNKVVEFVLRHAALQVAPPMTGVSDGVMNPYTASLQPNTILPVASNDNGNPSLRVLEMGGDFRLTESLMEMLKDSLRKKMLGPAESDGAIKSATEISTSDRDRLWGMGGEYSRVQTEILAPIMARGAFILQKKGLMPKFKVNGREVSIKYTSPFAKSQAAEDINALTRTLNIGALIGPESVGLGLKVEDIPAWIARKEGVDESLIRTPDEKKQIVDKAAEVAMAAEPAEGQPAAGAV